MPYSITPTITSTRAAPQNQPSYALWNVLPTPETFFSPNTPYPITPAVIPARAAPQDQSLDVPHNIPLILKISSPFNAPITPATALANAQLPISLGISLASETFFINAGPISDLNDKSLNREPLKTVSSNIRQKQSTTYRRKIPNLYEVVIDFSLSNTGPTSANSSFGSISFASNKDNWENSTPGTIYKSSYQTPNIETNIECKPVKEGSQSGKKQQLTFEEKQAKVAENEVAKLQVAEKKKLKKKIKKVDDLTKKALNKEAKKI